MPPQVILAAAKRGKLSKTLASASTKSVSSLNAIISRTSKVVKVCQAWASAHSP